MAKTRNYRLAQRSRAPNRVLGFGTGFRMTAPSIAPSHKSSDTRNAILEGVQGAPPDPHVFKCYMMARGKRGYIPTLLRDWVTAHPKYHAEAFQQVKAWIEENRHLFKQRGNA